VARVGAGARRCDDDWLADRARNHKLDGCKRRCHGRGSVSEPDCITAIKLRMRMVAAPAIGLVHARWLGPVSRCGVPHRVMPNRVFTGMSVCNPVGN